MDKQEVDKEKQSDADTETQNCRRLDGRMRASCRSIADTRPFPHWRSERVKPNGSENRFEKQRHQHCESVHGQRSTNGRPIT
ncbi:hypothetical protein TYRP_017867 [Tyrophagus putrescentiae]|nr:hypothetical protein TYRP_017867 [Tyrophagus putrescentiae]